MWDWAQLSALGDQLPNLEVLRMNGNRMYMPTLPPQGLSPSATMKLRMLVLNSCGLNSWAQVALLERTLPCLDTLSLAFNDLEDLELILEAQANGGADAPPPTPATAAATAPAALAAEDGAAAEAGVVVDDAIVDRDRFVAVSHTELHGITRSYTELHVLKRSET